MDDDPIAVNRSYMIGLIPSVRFALLRTAILKRALYSRQRFTQESSQ